MLFVRADEKLITELLDTSTTGEFTIPVATVGEVSRLG